MHLLSFVILIAFSAVSLCMLVDKCFAATASRHALAFRLLTFVVFVAVCLTLIVTSMSMCLETRYTFSACLLFPFKSLPY